MPRLRNVSATAGQAVEVVVDDDSDAGGQDEVLDLGEALSEVLFAVKNVHENVIRKIYFNRMNLSSSVAK